MLRYPPRTWSAYRQRGHEGLDVRPDRPERWHSIYVQVLPLCTASQFFALKSAHSVLQDATMPRSFAVLTKLIQATLYAPSKKTILFSGCTMDSHWKFRHLAARVPLQSRQCRQYVRQKVLWCDKSSHSGSFLCPASQNLIDPICRYSATLQL